MTTMVIVLDAVYDSNWYANLSASNHVTCDANYLTSKMNYSGEDQLQMGNGAGMDIMHFGNSILQSPNSNSVLHLKNILHSPSIKKNLISVSKCSQATMSFSNSILMHLVKSQYK